MTGIEAVEHIHAQSWIGRKPGLERTKILLEKLGNPHLTLKFVHITGTNGKGSTASMTASVLTESGYRTGLFTSPHLYHFHERMQVDGAPIPDEALGQITEEVLTASLDMREDGPTEFELMMAIGMVYFARIKCDIVVLEVGLGGRLDSTNVIAPPEVAVITNIGLEHTEQLGNTLSQIATEKSGIIKSGCHTVLYGQSDEVEAVVHSVCSTLEVPLFISDSSAVHMVQSNLEGQTFTYRGKGPYHITLLGNHQMHNALVVLEIAHALQLIGWNLTEKTIVQGLKKATWPGRLELAQRSPDFIVDGGHNPQCLEALISALEALYPEKKIIFLTGVLGTKDFEDMFRRAMPIAKSFVAVTPDSPRALPARALADFLAPFGVPVVTSDTVAEGVAVALELATPDDVICAWGSLYSVGEIRHQLGLC